MPFTVRELINKAYYLSGIVSRKFQSVSGEQITDGLNLLNEALAEEGITGSLIPYYKEYSLTAVAGQEKYFIPGLIQAETFTFNIGSVRYSLNARQRHRYFGTARQDNIQSLPYEWHIERTLNGADLYIYFLPSTNYPMKLWGKFKLDELDDLCEDLLLTYDRYYLKYPPQIPRITFYVHHLQQCLVIANRTAVVHPAYLQWFRDCTSRHLHKFPIAAWYPLRHFLPITNYHWSTQHQCVAPASLPIYGHQTPPCHCLLKYF